MRLEGCRVGCGDIHVLYVFCEVSGEGVWIEWSLGCSMEVKCRTSVKK